MKFLIPPAGDPKWSVHPALGLTQGFLETAGPDCEKAAFHIQCLKSGPTWVTCRLRVMRESVFNPDPNRYRSQGVNTLSLRIICSLYARGSLLFIYLYQKEIPPIRHTVKKNILILILSLLLW